MGVARQDGGRASRLAGIRGPGVAAHGVTHLEGTEQTVVKFQLQGRARQPGFIRLGGWVLRVDGKWPQTAGPLLPGVDQLQVSNSCCQFTELVQIRKYWMATRSSRVQACGSCPITASIRETRYGGGDVIIYPVEVALQLRSAGLIRASCARAKPAISSRRTIRSLRRPCSPINSARRPPATYLYSSNWNNRS